MKKAYAEIEIEVLLLNAEDILTSSNDGEWDDNE